MKQDEIIEDISLEKIQIRDPFWNREMELVRKEVLPYQWELLNDRIPGAAPSFCIRNFRVAGKLMREKKKNGASWKEPKYTYRGFESLPADRNDLKDEFYGFVFQDSDLYKWIEAAAYSLTMHPDPELEKTVDEAIEIICAAQQENGYLDTYYIIGGMDQIFTNLKDHHELYCLGHLIEAAVAYYEAVGKDRLLNAAIRFADYVDSVFGPEKGKCKGYPGHELAEMALIRLYELTKEKRYLNLALFFLNERGTEPIYWMSEKGYRPGDEKNYSYNQSHLPVREQKEAVGHAVRAMYLYCAMADAARITGDEKLWDACRNLWDSTVCEKLYITGGAGATSIGEAFSFPYDLPNDLAYAETCASVGLVFWAWRMLKNEQVSEYADIMELSLYNTILAGMAQDGKSFFYVNPLEVLPEACKKDKRKAHVKPTRQKWFGCACCPPNLARTVASVGKYAFTKNAETLWIHLFIGAEVNAGKGKVRIESGFPWNGDVTIRILESLEEDFSLAIRIPGWCQAYDVQTSRECTRKMKAGYLYLTGTWKKDDTIELHFPMTIQAMTANPLVREDIGKIAVQRGPFVYCMEEADNGKNLHLLEAKLPLQTKEVHTRLTEQGEVCIDILGRRQSEDKKRNLYRAYEKAEYREVWLHYLPYFLWSNRGEGEMQVWTRFFE